MSRSDGGFDLTFVRPVLGALGSVSVLIGLLYYVGWVKTNEVASSFGIDPSLLSLSTTDYVLRSISPLLAPAAVSIGVLVAGLHVHRAAVARFPRRWLDRARRLGPVVAAAAVPFAAVGLNGITELGAQSDYRAPVAMAVAAVLIAYGAFLSSLEEDEVDEADEPKQITGRVDGLTALAVASFLAMALFAFATLYALAVGQDDARRLAADLLRRPEAVLVAEEPLHLSGIEPEVMTSDANGSLQYRYSGLRLLLEAGDRWFLTDPSWGNGLVAPVHVIPTGDDVRLDLRFG